MVDFTNCKINKKELIEFSIVLVISILIFTPFLIGHYATDTYNVVNVGYENYAVKWSLNDGRIFMSLLVLLASKIHLSIEIFVFITLFLALITSSISVIYVKKIIYRYKTPKNLLQEILTITISYITIFNFMNIETMYFVECFVISVSVLIFILAADILILKEKNSILKSLLLVIIGVLFYQGSICMYFMTTLLISILKNKNNYKQIIIDVIKSGIIALVSVLLNMILVSIIGNIYGMEQNRINGIDKIFLNIRKIIKYTPNVLINTCNLFPKGFYLIFTFALILLVTWYNKENKKVTNIVLKLVAIFIMGILSSSVVFIMAFTSFYTGRLRIAIGATIGMMFILLFTETDLFEKNKIFKNMASSILGIYVLTTIVFFELLMLSHKKVNKIEKSDVEKINNYISQYEKETGIKVNKIAKVGVSGREQEAYYLEVKNKSTFTYTAIRSELAADAVVNFYTGRGLETRSINYKSEKELINKATESERGYICIGDTFFINVYMF